MGICVCVCVERAKGWDSLCVLVLFLCAGCVFVWQKFQGLTHIFRGCVCKQINTRRHHRQRHLRLALFVV